MMKTFVSFVCDDKRVGMITLGTNEKGMREYTEKFAKDNNCTAWEVFELTPKFPDDLLWWLEECGYTKLEGESVLAAVLIILIDEYTPKT